MDADYRLFVRIVATGSLSAAAREFRLSPAMVSKRLARLEARLGVQLLRRTTRRLELTERGARFHDDVVAILAAVEAAETRLAGRTREPAGPLRITAPTAFGRLHVAPLLARFVADHPRVEPEIDLSDGFSDLVGERIDLAIRISAGVDRAMTAERLATSRRLLCAAPGYLEAHGMPDNIKDLPRHRLLAARGQLPWRLERHGRTALIDGESLIGTNSSELVRELALAGAGIALRSLWEVNGDLAAGRLVRVLPEVEGSTDVAIYAVRPPAAVPQASVDAFVAVLRAALQPVPPWER